MKQFRFLLSLSLFAILLCTLPDAGPLRASPPGEAFVIQPLQSAYADVFVVPAVLTEAPAWPLCGIMPGYEVSLSNNWDAIIIPVLEKPPVISLSFPGTSMNMIYKHRYLNRERYTLTRIDSNWLKKQYLSFTFLGAIA